MRSLAPQELEQRGERYGVSVVLTGTAFSGKKHFSAIEILNARRKKGKELMRMENDLTKQTSSQEAREQKPQPEPAELVCSDCKNPAPRLIKGTCKKCYDRRYKEANRAELRGIAL